MGLINKDRLRAVLFDMDSVLFDSMPNHAYAWSRAMGRFGLAMTVEEAYMHEGRTGEGTIDILARRYWGRPSTENERQFIYQAKSELFATCPEARPMPGAAELLAKVKAEGLDIVLVTGSAQTSLLERLDKSFPGMFRSDMMVTGTDVRQGKPYPEPYLMGLQKAGITAAEAVVVENAPLGVQAAHAAGIFTIAVNTGPLSDKVLKDSGADIVLPGMEALAHAW